jgi:serine/threonine protein kinase
MWNCFRLGVVFVVVVVVVAEIFVFWFVSLDNSRIGMKYLHSQKPQIIHRDLTCANVLLTAGNTALICDFGISRMKSDSQAMTAAMGSLAYMAPEVFRGDNYDASCDVFSFAVVLFELVTFARVPVSWWWFYVFFFFFYTHTHSLSLLLFLLFEKPNNISPHLWASLCATEGQRLSLSTVPQRYASLIERCWNGDASLRPSYARACESWQLLYSKTHAHTHVHSFGEIENYCQTTLSKRPARTNVTGLVSSASMSSSSLSPQASLDVTASMALAHAGNVDAAYVSYVDSDKVDLLVWCVFLVY